MASSLHGPCDVPARGRNQKLVTSLDKAQIACTDRSIFLSGALQKMFFVLFSVCPDMDIQSKEEKKFHLCLYTSELVISSGCCLPSWQQGLCYHCPSSHTLHKNRLLLVHVSWQEGWAGVSSPCLTPLMGPPMSAGFPPHTLQMPFCWNSMGHKLSEGRAQGC